MQLVKYEQNGLELWVDESTGLAYAHLSAIARMLGMNPTNGTLRRRLEGLPKDMVKTAEVLTNGGLQGLPLYPSSVVFRLALEFNPVLAEAMGNCGANVYMLGQAGYEVKVATAPAPTFNPATPLLAQQVAGVADVVQHITETLTSHPRLAQILIDTAMNTVIEHQPVLPGKTLRGVAEIASEMGYKVDASNRTRLGRFIVNLGYQATKEPRLCNGVMTPINCYEDTPEIRESIEMFFS